MVGLVAPTDTQHICKHAVGSLGAWEECRVSPFLGMRCDEALRNPSTSPDCRGRALASQPWLRPQEAATSPGPSLCCFDNVCLIK